MRPHEEEWELEAPSPDGCIRVIAKGKKGEALALTPERARLLVAAPDMARALLALLAEKQGIIMTRDEAELFMAAQMALLKAGVLP